MPNVTLIDSGPLVALFDKDDDYHEQAKAFLKEFKGKLLTTTAVLTEVCYLLDFSIRAQIDFLTWVKNGAVQLEELTSLDLERIIELTQKYADLPMDFADSTLVAIGERLNVSQIASVDKDFYIYRFRQKKAFTNIFL
ncbi:pilus assembly protein [candidate division KSB1 bacterium RBG_16_48_16]|nr:MAG: pilus assembly protein [candidate division KSB1 bacterium RBG_16_48_16]